MPTLTVELGARSYPITIEAQALTSASLFDSITSSQIVVISNETVAPLYLDTLLGTLAQAVPHATATHFLLPDGEQYKTLEYFGRVNTFLLEQHASRDTTVIALGGGVVGDLTGFVAACYQRGIDFIQVPTTLLSQVDSSVGGKTAVNHPLGKNMIGAFYQPQSVIIDIETLRTLPAREFAAGMAEVIKYGIIYDAAFFSWLESHADALQALDSQTLTVAVERCCAIKAEIVAQDEKEKGLRALLNLGHTFGHAIEAEMGYGTWLHGEAVAAGMNIACQVAHRLDWLSVSDCRRVESLLSKFGLPIAGPESMDYASYIKHMAHDKKVLAGKIRYIIPNAIGHAVVTDEVPTAIIEHILGS